MKSSIAISCCTKPIAVVSNGAVKATLRTFQPPEPLETTTVPAGRILSVYLASASVLSTTTPPGYVASTESKTTFCLAPVDFLMLFIVKIF